MPMHSTLRSLLLLSSAAVLAAGCASTGGGARSTHNVVTVQDLEREANRNLYEALMVVRPAFLRSRGTAGTATESVPIQVYVDGIRMEGVDHLRRISASTVREVRYLDPQQAASRFGPNHNNGALLVVMIQ